MNMLASRTMVAQLSDILTATSQLTKLLMSIPCRFVQVFSEALIASNIVLASVEILFIGPFNDFMVAMCPSVASICTHDWRSGPPTATHSLLLIHACSDTSKVRRLDMEEEWYPSLLQGETRLFI